MNISLGYTLQTAAVTGTQPPPPSESPRTLPEHSDRALALITGYLLEGSDAFSLYKSAEVQEMLHCLGDESASSCKAGVLKCSALPQSPLPAEVQSGRAGTFSLPLSSFHQVSGNNPLF